MACLSCIPEEVDSADGCLNITRSMNETSRVKLHSCLSGTHDLPPDLHLIDLENSKLLKSLSCLLTFNLLAGAESLGKCLYVSGVPGTGKTASVLEVMKGLRKAVEAEDLPNFQFVELNSLRLPSAQHIYTHLLEVCPIMIVASHAIPSFETAVNLIKYTSN